MGIKDLLKKKYGEHYYNDVFPTLNKQRTNIPGLDVILSGGLPLGRIIEIVGQSSVCKTTLALHIAKSFIDDAKEVVYVDCEATVDGERLTDIGIDTKLFHLYRPDNGEDALDFAIDALEAGAKLAVIDSVPMLISKKVVSNEVGQLAIAPQARLLSAEQHRLIAACYRTGGSIIFINQMRQNVGGYGNPNIPTGGKALEYMSSVILELNRVDIAKDGSGLTIAAKTRKNKTGVGNQVTEFFVAFPNAIIDSYSSMKDALEKKGFLKRAGSYFCFTDDLKELMGQDKNIQGGKGVVEFLKNNKNHYEYLYNLILASPLEETHEIEEE